MNTTAKKLLALVLSIVMVLALVACGGDTTPAGNETPNQGNETPNQGGEQAGNNEPEYPAYVTAPVTIEYWHNHGGALGEWMDECVADFNATNQYGITVVATNQGGYGDILSKVKSSYGTDVSPNMAIVGAGGIEELAGAGAFADLAGYVARDNFDLENIPEGLRYYMQHYEGQVIEFPFLVSTTIIYYNKEYFPTEPQTLEEWVAMSKKIKEEHDIYGMAMWLDCGFIQRPVIKSLGAPGLCTADGTGPAAELLGENSVLYTYLADYRSWIDEGFCHPITVTDASTNIKNAFFNGQLASYVESSASMNGNVKAAEEAGIDLGFCSFVGYGGKTAGLGGGGFAVLSDSTQQETAACWEFIKYLLSDEKQIEKHKVSGYLPFSYSAVENEDLKAFWAENPGYEVAFKTQDVATYNDWSLKLNAWRSEITKVFQGVLVDGSMTVEQAVEQLEKQATVVFS